MRAFLLTSALLVLAQIARADGPDLKVLRSSVVKVLVVSQGEDYSQPWQRPEPDSASGSAFNIGNKMLLTNAHVVSDAKNLLVKRADSAPRYEARVLFVGHDCDLAVMTVDDPAFWKGLTPLSFGPRPALRSSVSAVGFPMGGAKLSITEGVVSRIEIQTYSHTRGDQHLAIQIDAAINPGNSGGPVIQGDKVVGVAFQGQFFAQNIGYMIPPSVIHHFLDDIKDGHYDGYPELGIYTANLENDTLRAYLGVPKDKTGVVVLDPVPEASAVGYVKRNDVLHAIDGIPIHNDGTIDVGGELLDYTFLVESKHVGDHVKLTVSRNGKVQDVDVPLKAWKAKMKMSLVYDQRPEFLVKGGYVFQPLSLNYLYQVRGTEELIYYMQQFYRTIATRPGETREQLVLLTQVLPHPSTAYRNYRNAIVSKVDGVVPKDFADFVRLIDAGKGHVKIEFEGVNVAPLILDLARIAKVQPQILSRYGISEDRYVLPEEK